VALAPVSDLYALLIVSLFQLKTYMLYRLQKSREYHVRKTFVAGPLSAPNSPLPGPSRVINSLLTYLLGLDLSQLAKVWVDGHGRHPGTFSG